MIPEELTIEEFIEAQRIRYKRPNKSRMMIHVTLYYGCGHILNFDFNHWQYQRHTVPYFDYVYQCEVCNKAVPVKKYTVRRVQ